MTERVRHEPQPTSSYERDLRGYDRTTGRVVTLPDDYDVPGGYNGRLPVVLCDDGWFDRPTEAPHYSPWCPPYVAPSDDVDGTW